MSRASHCHQTPHALRAQRGPVTRPIAPKSTVSSPAATATRSAACFPRKRYTTLAIPQTNTAVNIAIHAGTWK